MWDGFDEIHWSGELAPREIYRASKFKRRWGFKSKTQLPLFMVWDEEWLDGEVIYARVVFTSKDYIGF